MASEAPRQEAAGQAVLRYGAGLTDGKEAEIVHKNIEYYRPEPGYLKQAELILFDCAMTCWEHVRPDPPKINISNVPAKGKPLLSAGQDADSVRSKIDLMQNASPIYPSREQQRFRAVQDAVKQLVEAKLPNVEFHTVPSKSFFVYRKGRPALRMDVELDEETGTIRYATNPDAIGMLQLRKMAGDEVRVFNGVHLLKSDEETAELLLTPFFL